MGVDERYALVLSETLCLATVLTRLALGKYSSPKNRCWNGYIIASAITTINFAIELAEIHARHGSVDEQETSAYNISGWKDTVARLAPSLPYDSTRSFHPEFEGMPLNGFQAKQADTLMLQYPLMFNHSTMTGASRRNDLDYYSKHSLISPDMTQAICAQHCPSSPPMHPLLHTNVVREL